MKRGEVWRADLNPARGSEQAGTRPVLVLQADSLTASLPTAVIIPFTTTLRWARFSFCALVSAGEGGLVSDSVALCFQIRVCDQTRLLHRMGQLTDATMLRIEQAVRVTLGL